MNGAALPPRAQPFAASTPVFVATFVGILATTVLMLFLDLLLARIDRRESDAHAAAEYQTGASLLAAGQPAAAAERFGAAVAIDRGNKNYALALGEAMLAGGRVADAEVTLKALLDRAENDGSVNLAMAHVMVREGRLDDASAYFHRAIFGRWGLDSTDGRAHARFELIDLLARQGAAPELLAELLLVEPPSPDSVSLRRRLGHLFILAGSPARATGMFRELLRRDPHDADAYAGMGEAALALGNFETARADLAEASRLLPADTGIANRLALADTVLALDPAARGIGARERLVRSRALLARTAAALTKCSRSRASASSEAARVTLAARPQIGHDDVLSDAMIGLSSDLWTGRPTACTPAAVRDDALRLVLGRLAQ